MGTHLPGISTVQTGKHFWTLNSLLNPPLGKSFLGPIQTNDPPFPVWLLYPTSGCALVNTWHHSWTVGGASLWSNVKISTKKLPPCLLKFICKIKQVHCYKYCTSRALLELEENIAGDWFGRASLMDLFLCGPGLADFNFTLNREQ